MKIQLHDIMTRDTSQQFTYGITLDDPKTYRPKVWYRHKI